MRVDSNIYLTGMMGSGKSVTGKKLAQLLSYSFTDLDECIQEKTGRSIRSIFEKEGEVFFRRQETFVLSEISECEKNIVATGGGAVLDPDNVRRMKQTGKICFLETSLSVLWERVKNKKDRPLLKGGDPYKNLEKIFQERLPVYKSSADFEVNTDGQTAEAVARKILGILKGSL